VNPLRAEWRKLVTLPSLWLTAALTLSATLLLAYVLAAAGQPDGLTPLGYTQAGFVAFGVLAAASEHQGGDQIRVTLVAMPRRLPLYAAKMLALAAVTVPFAAAVGGVSTVAAGEAGRWPAATVYLVLTTLLAAAVGGLVRRAEIAAVLLLAGYFIVFPLLRGRYGAALPDTAALDPSRGAAATAIWAAGAVALAGYAFHRRDA
jgi:ABC-2 type transport system permease protein